jgi:two-component system KDP operon response regulator KdpE
LSKSIIYKIYFYELQNATGAERNVTDILLVSSQHEEGKVWQYALQQRGYNTRLVTSPPEAITSMQEADYRLIIIDVFKPLAIMIPVVKQLRIYSTAPILLMIPERDIPYVVSALEAGADDTLIKPVGLPLFLTKVQIWIYRSGTGATELGAMLKIGELQINPLEQTVVVRDKPSKLTPNELISQVGIVEGQAAIEGYAQATGQSLADVEALIPADWQAQGITTPTIYPAIHRNKLMSFSTLVEEKSHYLFMVSLPCKAVELLIAPIPIGVARLIYAFCAAL